MVGDDELAKKWGAWGGDRKLSPRFPTPARRSNGYAASTLLGALLGVVTLVAFLIFM